MIATRVSFRGGGSWNILCPRLLLLQVLHYNNTDSHMFHILIKKQAMAQASSSNSSYLISSVVVKAATFVGHTGEIKDLNLLVRASLCTMRRHF